MSRVIVFDVNETLLDLAALDTHFQRLFDDPAVRREWFGQLLQSALVTTVLGEYRDFATIGRHALTQVAERHGVAVDDEDRELIGGAMRSLPPHPEVPAALGRLRDAGLRLAALTNSPPAQAEAQLSHAGLSGFLERIMTVDLAQRLKPAREVYTSAARELGVETGGMRMVAAHAWDIAGAMHAGCAGAFVARPGQVLDPLFPPPDIIGADLTEVADAIVDAET